MVVEVEAELLRARVARPTVPSVEMNANASGTPPKFAATPEKVMSAGRMKPRSSWRERRVGDQEAERTAEERGDEADLDALLVGVERRALEDVLDELAS